MSLEWGYSLLRSYPLEDLNVRGDGRTVEAYAAIYDTPAEIHDSHGDYMEVVSRGAFDRMLSRWNNAQERPVVLYNHGMTMHGTPSDIYSVPIGVPVEIRNDQKGLFTVSRYNDGEDAERILRAIDNGAITGYSFRGKAYQSKPMGRPGRARPGAALPTITRTELGLNDFGPTPAPYYTGASIMAVRSATQLASELEQLDEEQLLELLERFNITATPDEDSADIDATPEVGLGAEDSPAKALLSAADIARRARAALITRSIK